MKTNIISQLWNFKSVGTLSPNQYQIYFDNWEIFQSYDSIIVVQLYNWITYIWADYKYSNTTSKYRVKFLGEDLKETETKIKNWEYKMLD